MAKKFNLPYFAKATKGFSLSSALVTEEFDMETGTEAEAFAFADFDKPWGSGGESFTIGAFGHEKDPVGGNRWKVGQETLDFGQIVFS